MSHLFTRRSTLLALASMGASPLTWAKPELLPPSQRHLVASWRQGHTHHIGLMPVREPSKTPMPSMEIPTRAHGLVVEEGGSVLAMARRPGDWLLRWHPASNESQWHWIEGDRRFNGHACSGNTTGHPSRHTILTTETHQATADGLVGVRDAASLSKVQEWATHGKDPHALLTLPEPVGGLPRGTLMVANGGIPTRPETGRIKIAPGQMDASLVALSPTDGQLLGLWRLSDPYLSIRHLAWNARSRSVGVALQSEHPDATAQTASPVLAIWQGRGLVLASDQPALTGYGGDICALSDGGFLVSCPRANTLATFDQFARFRSSRIHSKVCALTSEGEQWWAGGSEGLLHASNHQPGLTHAQTQLLASSEQPMSLELDNHWQPYLRG